MLDHVAWKFLTLQFLSMTDVVVPILKRKAFSFTINYQENILSKVEQEDL